MTDNTAAGILGCCHFSDEYKGIKYLCVLKINESLMDLDIRVSKL